MKIKSNFELTEIDVLLIKNAIRSLSEFGSSEMGLNNFYTTLFYEDFNRKINLSFIKGKCYRCAVEIFTWR